MKWVGLVGLIGSGKSTAAKMLVDRGCRVIDVDVLNRELQQPGQELYRLIVDHFGDGILTLDGTIDRAVLGAIVFNDRQQLAELTGIVASETEQELIRRALEFVDTETVVLVETAMIVGRMYGLEAIVLVDAPYETALERLVAQRGLSEEDARARLDSQVPRDQRFEAADYVIDNSGDLDQLETEVVAALEWISANTADALPRVVRRAGEQSRP